MGRGCHASHQCHGRTGPASWRNTVCDPQTLASVTALPETVLVAVAVHIGHTRLIDHALYISPQEGGVDDTG